MGKNMRSIIIALAAVAAAGCSSQPTWHGPPEQEAKFRRDVYECQSEAARLYPPNAVQTAPAVQGSSQTQCRVNGKFVNCSTTPGLTYAQPVTMDTNAPLYAQSVQSCMMARGYRPR